MRFRSRVLAVLTLLTAVLAVGAAPSAAVVPAAPGLLAPGENVWYDTAGNRIRAQSPSFVRQGDWYYMFGMKNQTTFQGVNVYRSRNLVDWEFVALAMAPQGTGLASGTYPMYRPSVVYNDATRTWVMWMETCVPPFNVCFTTPRYGVATSSSLTGPYTYRGDRYLPGDRGSLDGKLFKDDDGQAYWVVNENVSTLSIFRLRPDYLAVESRVYAFPEVREGPAMFKRNGRYYVIASGLTGWYANENWWSSATSIAGPWTPFARLAPNSTNTYESQTGSALTVTGSRGTTVIAASDRWTQGGWEAPDKAKPVWMPLRFDDRSGAVSIPEFKETFGVDVANGEWYSDGTVDDSATGTGPSRWSFSAGWSRSAAPAGRGDFRGESTGTTTAGATATLPFLGRSVSLHAVVGPTAGQVAVSVDGGAETTVNLRAGVAGGDQLVFHRPGLAPGEHTLRVRALGGGPVAVDRAEVTGFSVEDTATGTGPWQISYGPGWGQGYGGLTGRSSGTNHYTWDSNVTRTATFTFRGTGVDFYGAVGPSFGQGSVQIDDQPPVPIDQYRNDDVGEVGDQLLWRSPTLAQGTHTLTIRSFGTKRPASSSTFFSVDRLVTRP